MPKPGRRHPVDEWRNHIVKDDLDLIANSWKKLAGPIARIEKIVDDLEAGGQVEVPPALREALDDLLSIQETCPVPKGPRGPCWAKPTPHCRPGPSIRCHR